jgi:hypothetical protein
LRFCFERAQHPIQPHRQLARDRHLGDPRSAATLVTEQLQNQPRVAIVGLLMANVRGTNFRSVPDPQLMAQFGEQSLDFSLLVFCARC